MTCEEYSNYGFWPDAETWLRWGKSTCPEDYPGGYLQFLADNWNYIKQSSRPDLPFVAPVCIWELIDCLVKNHT